MSWEKAAFIYLDSTIAKGKLNYHQLFLARRAKQRKEGEQARARVSV